VLFAITVKEGGTGQAAYTVSESIHLEKGFDFAVGRQIHHRKVVSISPAKVKWAAVDHEVRPLRFHNSLYRRPFEAADGKVAWFPYGSVLCFQESFFVRLRVNIQSGMGIHVKTCFTASMKKQPV
jgi:hypothetical protein